MLVILDRQHVGKPGHDETGAWGDFDLDGMPDVVEQEAIVTGFIAMHCEVRLRELGHKVVTLSDGRYADRHARAKAYGGDAYIALHLNAGRGRYGATFYDYRSKMGPVLAECIGLALKDAFDFPVKVEKTAPTGTNYPRPFPCISGVFDGKPVACLVEPLFMDHPEHQQILAAVDGPQRIGYALAEGIHLYSEAKKKEK